MNRKAVIYSVPLGMAHRSAATARSWPSPITNSLPATPRYKESSRSACRPVGGQMYCRWRDSPRMPSVFGRQQRPRWSDPGHPAGCRDSIIPPNRDAWRLPGPDRHIARPALRRSRLGETCGCVVLSPVVLPPSPLSRAIRRTPRLRGANWDRGHARSGEGGARAPCTTPRC
jgi:hypothetical protein